MAELALDRDAAAELADVLVTLIGTDAEAGFLGRLEGFEERGADVFLRHPGAGVADFDLRLPLLSPEFEPHLVVLPRGVESILHDVADHPLDPALMAARQDRIDDLDINRAASPG